tara:strand:- start:663 stop:1316 length:654 start_codon:yes stop_codon:yes gene_type:complete
MLFTEKMKKNILLLSFLIVTNIYAQDEKCLTQLNINFGKTFTTFIYGNNSSNADLNINFTTGNSYTLDLGFQLGDKHMLHPEVRYQQYGAQSTVDNTPISWRLNYLGAGLGYFYSALTTDFMSIAPGLVFNANYMVSGEQTFGTLRFDIKEDELLKPVDVVTSIALNSRFKVTEYLFINFEYRFGISLTEIENENGNNDEKTRNLGHIAALGLSFNL